MVVKSVSAHTYVCNPKSTCVWIMMRDFLLFVDKPV